MPEGNSEVAGITDRLTVNGSNMYLRPNQRLVIILNKKLAGQVNYFNNRLVPNLKTLSAR